MNDAQPRSLQPAADAAQFRWPVRVYYEDTDSGGVVYYANYLRFLERCRTEWMRSLGYGQAELADRHGVLFVVASVNIEYRRPARLDEELLVTARIAERYSSYVVFEQQVLRGVQELCRARAKVACVAAATLRPTRLPDGLAAALALLQPVAGAPSP